MILKQRGKVNTFNVKRSNQMHVYLSLCFQLSFITTYENCSAIRHEHAHVIVDCTTRMMIAAIHECVIAKVRKHEWADFFIKTKSQLQM